MRKFIVAFLLILGYCIYSSGQVKDTSIQLPGACSSYSLSDNEIIFECDDGSGLLLKLCSNNIVKIWFDPKGNFSRENSSFAVLSEEIQLMDSINIEESASAYEVFTGSLRIRVNRNPLNVQFFDKYQRLIMGDYLQYGHVSKGDFKSSYKTLRDDEHFFGLGEKAGPLDRRGEKYKMWNSDKPCYSIDEDPLYKSIAFFMSSYNYGLFFDNSYKTEFDFGSESDEYFSFETPAGEMIYYFIYGKDYKEIISDYTQLTGKPIMPPKWAFGFSQCRGYLTNEILSREIASNYRNKQIPCDIIYQDIGWTENLQDFEWKKNNYANPKKMVQDLDKQGFKIIVSQDPVVSKTNTKQWNEADSSGYFTIDVRTGKSYDMPWPWGGNCGLVDFTAPGSDDWWGGYQQKVLDDGVRGFWTDMGEPAWSNEENTDRLFMKHYAGMHDEIHNVYGLTWDKVVTEQFEKRNPNKRIFQLTRAGYAGMQRYTFGWSGDAGNGSDVTDGWRLLSNQIPLCLSAGMGLIPFWACDISGYCGDIDDYAALSELYVRWLQFGVFNPISRAHHEGNNAVEPWLFGAEAERISKSAIEMKYRLFPYIYTYAREAYETGLPLMRALLLEYPNEPGVFGLEAEFLFGRELLVAPVVEKDADIKDVYLPEGKWIDFNDGQTQYNGSQWIEYPVQLSTVPIFVKSGSIIPMMPVMQYIHEDSEYPLILEIFPAQINKDASFELYEDDGENNDYKNNVFLKRKINCRSLDSGYEITYKEDIENNFKSIPRNLIYKIHLGEKPTSIKLSGKKLKAFKCENSNEILNKQLIKSDWTWDKENNVCAIRILYSETHAKLIIEK